MRKKKEITAYQINNVLRVYGDQLRKGMISNRHKGADPDSPDKISISAKVRREIIADDITSNIIERITQPKLNDNVESTVFKEFDSEHGESLNINESPHNGLTFKQIDGNGETINLIAIEDSKFLRKN